MNTRSLHTPGAAMYALIPSLVNLSFHSYPQQTRS
jgi:hypothetical protein